MLHTQNYVIFLFNHKIKWGSNTLNSYVGMGIYAVGNLALSRKAKSLSTLHEGIWGNGSTAACILNVDAGCSSVISLPGGLAPGARCLGGWVDPRAEDEREPFVAAVNRTPIPCRFYYLCL
jgi:hypothetical protein